MTSNYIPLSVPNLNGNELNYVTEAIKTEWVSSAGSYVDAFESQLAKYVGVKNAVSCQNGTAGLHVALRVCKVKQHDLVICPTLTFIAAVNPIKYLGADPVFMDCDNSLCLDADKMELFLRTECIKTDGTTIHKKSGRKISAVVVVHVFGNMANMEKIIPLAEDYNLKVIEDATEALGTHFIEGKYKNLHAGTIGTVGVYSFNGNKIITTGGGGMIVSNDNELLKRAKHLTTQAKSDELYYLHDEIGYNYRMTNIQAAIGLAQLEQLEEFIKIKKRNYQLYKAEIDTIDGLILLEFNENARVNYWFYSLFIEDNYPLNRDELLKKMQDNKIQTRPIWGLISDQLPYKNAITFKIEKATDFIAKILNIPCSSNLSAEDVKRIINVL